MTALPELPAGFTDRSTPWRITRRSMLQGIAGFVAAHSAGLSAADPAPGKPLAGSASAAADSRPPTLLPLCLQVNGQTHVLNVDTRTTVLDALLEQLGLKGSKKGCDHGQCGACTVLIDGRRINACLSLAVTPAGSASATSR